MQPDLSQRWDEAQGGAWQGCMHLLCAAWKTLANCFTKEGEGAHTFN
jgi:hypothetical protein